MDLDNEDIDGAPLAAGWRRVEPPMLCLLAYEHEQTKLFVVFGGFTRLWRWYRQRAFHPGEEWLDGYGFKSRERAMLAALVGHRPDREHATDAAAADDADD